MLEDWKLFYIFRDPMGADECKIGITSHPAVRLGSYQNSYSRKSHIACFDKVYLGPSRAINNLERVVKQRFDWHIERDGRGASEWVSQDYLSVAQQIDEIINGFRFKVDPVPAKYLPLTVDNLDQLYNDFQLKG